MSVGHSIPPEWLDRKRQEAEEAVKNWQFPSRPETRDRRDPQELGNRIFDFAEQMGCSGSEAAAAIETEFWK